MTRVNNYKFNTSMINLIPSEYFGSEDCKYAALLDQIYQLTKVDQHKQNTEIEEGEIEVEEDEPRLEETKSEKLRENVQPRYGNISSLAEDLSLKKSSGSAKPQEVSSLPPLFPPLQFPALPPLPPHPSFYPGIPFPPLPLSYPGTLQGLPGLPGLPPPWPPLFLPSVPPPPLLSGLGLPGKPKCPPQPPPDAYLPPDEKEFKEARGFDLKILFELDTSPGRLSWIVGYMDFMAREGEPLSLCPSMYKEPLDLFKLYKAVSEEGGFRTCSANKAWKKISVKMTQNYRQSFLWRLLQKLYRKYLLKFEIFDKYDDKPANLEELCHLVT